MGAAWAPALSLWVVSGALVHMVLTRTGLQDIKIKF